MLGGAMLEEDVEMSQLNIPEWLEKGKTYTCPQHETPSWLERGEVRNSNTLRPNPHDCLSDHWSDASSEADDIGNLEELHDTTDAAEELYETIHLAEPKYETEEDVELDSDESFNNNLDTELASDLQEACGLKPPLRMRYTPDGSHCFAT